MDLAVVCGGGRISLEFVCTRTGVIVVLPVYDNPGPQNDCVGQFCGQWEVLPQ